MSPRICWIAVVLAAVASAQTATPAEPLCLAAFQGDAARVQLLLEKRADPNIRCEAGMTPLLYASLVTRRGAVETGPDLHRDYTAVARLLLVAGADVNARDEAGRTALLTAVDGSASEYKVIGGDDALARLLVERGANVNAQDRDGWTPLLKAVNVWADQPKLVAFLLLSGADANARLKDGRTALMLAARTAKSDRLEALIGSGADVNAADEKGMTTLMTAALVIWDDAALEMMKLLLAHGVRADLPNHDGRTALDLVAEAGYLSRVEFLLANGAKTTERAALLKRARDRALVRAVRESSTDEVRALLDRGADPDARNAEGRPALLIAADNDYPAEKAILLLDRGAAANAMDQERQTALMVAVQHYQPETVRALLAHRADPNAADGQGNSVLMQAAASKRNWMEERQPLIHLLLEKGADVNYRNAHGATALMLMAGEGNPALALLLAKGADVNARDDEGNTALLYAARFFVRGWPRRNGWALLEKGADVNASNRLGETALILAATQFEADCARLLLAKSANVNAKTSRGRTALMQAIDGPKEFDNERHIVYSPQIARVLMDAGADVNARDADGVTALAIALRRGYQEMADALRQAGAAQ
jgi:ankyrin repeat protein